MKIALALILMIVVLIALAWILDQRFKHELELQGDRPDLDDREPDTFDVGAGYDLGPRPRTRDELRLQLQTDPRDHAAADLWASLGPQPSEPVRQETIFQ